MSADLPVICPLLYTHNNYILYNKHEIKAMISSILLCVCVYIKVQQLRIQVDVALLQRLPKKYFVKLQWFL